MDKTNEKKETKETKAKAKKEKKFNSERVGRLAKAALKAVFPQETFVVSTFVSKVEVLYPIPCKVTPVEISTFKVTFCELVKVKREEFDFYSYEKKATA